MPTNNFVNWCRYDGKSVDARDVNTLQRDAAGVLRENIIIKGDNLQVLQNIQSQFAGKVKLVYIDPPYNTGGDANVFTYNNTFNHSAWLDFMQSRLVLARNLLREDGFIAIAIDDYEQAYLRVLCDEVFGGENFIGTVCVESNPGGRDSNKFFATSHEYCHCYAKNSKKAKLLSFQLSDDDKAVFNLKDSIGNYKLTGFMRTGGYSTPADRPKCYYPIFYNPETKDFSLDDQKGYTEVLPIDSKGGERVWRKTKTSFLGEVASNNVVAKFVKGRYKIFLKDRLTLARGKRPKTMWHDAKYSATTSGTMLLEKLLGHKPKFSYPKSLYTVLDTLKIMTLHDDIVLDFFAGSGTTAHAVLVLNQEDGGDRKFILVEQLDAHVNICIERIQKVMQKNKLHDNFVSCEVGSGEHSIADQKITDQFYK